MPAQPALVLRARLDEVLAVVEQQLDLQGRARRGGRRAGFPGLPGGRRGRPPGRRSGPTCRGSVRRGGFGPSASAARGRRARPRATRKRSREPETWRQSSIAQIRSSSRARAQSSSWRKPGSLAAAVSSPASWPVPATTAPQVWVCLWVSVPITIIWPVPSIGCRLRTDRRRTNLTGGDATLLSSQAGDPRVAAGDTTHGGQTFGSTASLGVSPPPCREPTVQVGRQPPTVGPTMTVRPA